MRNCDGSKWRLMTNSNVSRMRSCLFLKPRYKVIGVTWAWRATARTEDLPKPCLENSRIADSRILRSAFHFGLIGFYMWTTSRRAFGCKSGTYSYHYSIYIDII